MLVWIGGRRGFGSAKSPYVLGIGVSLSVRYYQRRSYCSRKEWSPLFPSLNLVAHTPFLPFSFPPLLPFTVETKLCDPDVNSQAGYYKISGSKDKNCTCVERSWGREGRREGGSEKYETSVEKASWHVVLRGACIYISPCIRSTYSFPSSYTLSYRLLLVLRVPRQPLHRSSHHLAHRRPR